MAEPSPLSLPYTLSLPETLRSGVVFASPHSGRDYPAEFVARSVLDLTRLRSSEDAFVDSFLSGVAAQGASLIAARYPRAYVDLNRAEDELDPALIEGLARSGGGARVAAGLGVIPRIVAGGRAIYSGKIPQAEAEARLAQVWRPYHAQLEALLAQRRARFGEVLLIDMHSMPSETPGAPASREPNIVLGDRFGTSASGAMVAAIERVFTGAGLSVARNAPFAGAYVASRYGRPAEGVHVVQVEINRGLYMDESRVRPHAGFAAFAAQMEGITAGLCALVRGSERMAAE